MEEVKSKILLAAKELFARQGYKKTTIRQIVEETGVLTGSIYHFFKNKEDIFQALVLELFNRCEKLVNERFDEKESPALRYAVMCAIELRAVRMNKLVCESYYEAYSSNAILEQLTMCASQRSYELFRKYNPNFTMEDYYIRTLMIKGAMRSCIVSCCLERDITYEQMLNTFLEISLSTFNVNQIEIEQVTGRIHEMYEDIIDMAFMVGEEGFTD
ncbi:TetR/AcrR family transcriptional regulator [Anaerocolumna xylanovorans]|uniref:TetR/AcrR family transcriptional regulator n=1 Tax=Anaerocolumna xylanovorans TaxID=100134 RepID=UPI0009375E9E|nr:helix-turn-helix domain-containing protein [Anaerocolumna xylanovorans]